MGLFGGDIELCPSGGDIELCLERDIELCTECTELTLTGDDEPEVGTTYEATGGAGELTFSFDKGTISITSTTPATDTEPRKVVATITAIDACGVSGESRVGRITVTDSCDPQQEEYLDVRLPDGIWGSGTSGYGRNSTQCTTAGCRDDCAGVGNPPWFTQDCISGGYCMSTNKVTAISGGYKFLASDIIFCWDVCALTDGLGGSLRLPWHGLLSEYTYSTNDPACGCGHGEEMYTAVCNWQIFKWVCP